MPNRQEMTTRERLEDDARVYGISIVTAAEWAVERAEKTERQARSNVTRAVNAIPKAERKCDARLRQLREYPNNANLPYEEGRVIGRVETAHRKIHVRVGMLARAAHVLADAQAELDSLKAAV